MLTISFIALLKQLSLAIVLGFSLGVEREIARKSAGIRTHILVSLGAALFSIISTSVIGPNVDPTRIAAQIVVGIGFLGGGMIIFQDSKLQGLTTAAGVWVAAAIGMAVGFELYQLAIVGTLLALGVFLVIGPIERAISNV
ncbi:MAG TPA: MgtC/SapB family protein [Candidatus Paceibacterota bacterium]